MITKEQALHALKQTFTDISDCSVERMIHIVKRDYEDVALALLVAKILVNHCDGQPWDAGLSDEQRQFMKDREWGV